jgi:very-short-patch-repair endonuclease
MYFDQWKVVVEIDGAHHMNVGQMWDDARRQNDLELAGYVVLRYPRSLYASTQTWCSPRFARR